MALSIYNIGSNDSIIDWFQSKKAGTTVQSIVDEIMTSIKTKVNNADSATDSPKSSTDANLENEQYTKLTKKYTEISVDYNKNMDYDEDGEVTLDEKFKYYSIQVAERLKSLNITNKLDTEKEEIKDKNADSKEVEAKESTDKKQNTEAKTETNQNADNSTIGKSEVKETTESTKGSSTTNPSVESTSERTSVKINHTQFQKVQNAYFNNSLVNNSILALSA